MDFSFGVYPTEGTAVLPENGGILPRTAALACPPVIDRLQYCLTCAFRCRGGSDALTRDCDLRFNDRSLSVASCTPSVQDGVLRG